MKCVRYSMQSIEEIPALLVDVWGIDLVVAQIILSTAIFFAVVLPIIIIRKDRSSFNIEVIGAFFALAICVGLGWLHVWVMIMAVVMTAIGAAAFGRDKILGA